MARTYTEFAASFFLFEALIYLTVIREMTADYISLVGSHLTQKERKVRKTTAKEYCREDTLKSEKQTFTQKALRAWRFFVTK
jgi:hypothetical protein